MWRDVDKLSDKDRKEAMSQQTLMIQEICEKGNLQKQSPEDNAQIGKDYQRSYHWLSKHPVVCSGSACLQHISDPFVLGVSACQIVLQMLPNAN